MRPRDPLEPIRATSSLEFFFDLVFAIAVATASVQLHEAYASGEPLSGLLAFAPAFFAIWWAWMNFTWFATSFDTDDWLYRVVTFVQMAGVLVLAAGIEPAFDDGNYTVVVLAYVLMRVAMIAQWLRASRGAGAARKAAFAYAGGIAAVQVLWLAWLLLDGTWWAIGFGVLIAAELAVPVLAERKGRTPWHPVHITDRYGCFTLILLGESLLRSATAVIQALHDHQDVAALAVIAVLALVVTAGLWWIYFWPPHHESIGSIRQSLRYGYGHYFIFAAASTFSAGVGVQIEITSGAVIGLSAGIAAVLVAAPIAVFLLGVWLIAVHPACDRVVDIAVLVCSGVVLAAPLLWRVTDLPLVVIAVAMVAMVAVLVSRPPREEPSSDRMSHLPGSVRQECDNV